MALCEGCFFASKTVRSVLCASGGGRGRRGRGEHVLEENDASHDELEAEYQEAMAMMTIEKQRRTEVDRARQFFRKPQSSEDRKARLDKLKQKLPCANLGQLGFWKDDNDCPAKVKVVYWEETEEHVTEEPHPFPVTAFFCHTGENGARQQVV